MTLNNVIQRIQTITLAHKQVRSFRKGLLGDLFADKTAKYPAVCLQDFGGNISLSGHATTLNYKLFFLDMVHVSQDTKTNEQDVQSDMVSIAMDVLAQMNNSQFDDWAISTSNNIELLAELENDMVAGCVVDVSVRIIYAQNICQIPTDLIDYNQIDESMKHIYDIKYTASGNEGRQITIPELLGKKIIFITRGNSTIYKTSSTPTSSEFVWDDTTIEVGADVNPGEPFLILYRNY